jgi:hypothetical protein
MRLMLCMNILGVITNSRSASRASTSKLPSTYFWNSACAAIASPQPRVSGNESTGTSAVQSMAVQVLQVSVHTLYTLIDM